MSILFSFDYPPNSGGISRLCAEIAKGLTARGCSVDVLTQQSSQRATEINAHVPPRRVTARRPLREVFALRALLACRKATVISGIWYPEGLLAQLAGVRHQVVLAHGAELYPPLGRIRSLLWRRLARYTLERAECVIANSAFTAHRVTALAPKARVVGIPLAVDHHRFQPSDRATARERWQIPRNSRVLCSVSRVHRYKGHEAVLEALSRLSPEIRARFVYLIAGTGPDTAYLKARAEELGITPIVRWLGFVADDELPSLYTAADLFVLMTREEPAERAVEGFGLVFLEAQACGTPVVGAAAGGIPDAISPGDGGWLIAPDDVEGLAALLHHLDNDPNEFTEAGRKARLRVERECTWDHYINRFTQILKTVGVPLHDH